ncbi:DNA repair protein XRCC4 isoform X2 [Varanus komodoensis]|uniref:DNA repair protein XRCC4 n=1 Tax=Varanus komodoensis TaxID=61221 RepID=A0A8D2KZZ2_VARKO|nr:DNA repair protein XRCC4 isoform X2 [Varanus komodoensis]
MEKKVRQICPVSDPGTTYFLQIAWQEDLGTGFDIILSDGQSAWAGRVPEEEISKEADDMEMKREKYIEELKKALLFREGLTDKYNFDISKEGRNGESLHFSYEKNLKDVSFRLGSLTLQRVSSPGDVIRELISYCLNCIAELNAKNEQLQKENERHRSDLEDMQEQFQKCVEAKEELETDLYKRFILVLNEKKAKIRSLQKCLNEIQESVVKTTEASGSAETSESRDEKEAYERSTDEESENLIQPSTSAPAKPRRDSLLSSDSTDVAPSRKRRQRTRKGARIEPKVALYETELATNEKNHPCRPVIVTYHQSETNGSALAGNYPIYHYFVSYRR